MDPILIVAYPDRIAFEQQWLDIQISYFQTVYNLFKTVDLTVTLSEINHVRHEVLKRHGENMIDNLVLDKMIIKAGNPHFNGLPIKKHMLKSMIDIPDVNFIRTWILENPIEKLTNYFNHVGGAHNNHAEHGDHLTPELFEIVAGVVQRKATTNALINAKYTHYTQNDKGVQTYNLLLDWRDHVNEFNVQLAAIKATFRMEHFGLDKHPDGILRPSLKVIRENEAKYPGDYVAV